MKLLLYSLTYLAIVVFSVNNVAAQKKISDAYLVYQINYAPENGGNDVNPFDGAEIKVWVKANQSKSESVSKLGIEVAFFNNNNNNGGILKEYSGQQLFIIMNENDWNEKNALFQKAVFSNTDNNKEINGVLCRQAVAQTPKGKIIVYYNPVFVLANTKYVIAFPGVIGLPVQIELYSAQNSKPTFTYNLKSSNFDIIPTQKVELQNANQYRTITYEEAKKIKKL